MELYADGPTLEEIENLKVDGYTFNPSLYKKLGATDYLDFSKKISNKIKSKPISIEVIGVLSTKATIELFSLPSDNEGYIMKKT